METRPLVRGSGPGVLLAHGAGGGVLANFGPILDELAASHTVVGVDYPGSGDTPRSAAPLDLDGLADGLVCGAVAAGVERFAILGYSLGTAVAVRAATRHPGRVSGLVLTAGLAAANRRLRLGLDVWRGLLEHGDRVLLARFLVLQATDPARIASMGDAELAATVDGLAAFIPPGSPEHVDLVGRVDTRAELAAVGVPTLVVATTRDVFVEPEHSYELAAGIPGATATEVACGHDIGAEARDEWLAAVLPFLATVS